MLNCHKDNAIAVKLNKLNRFLLFDGIYKKKRQQHLENAVAAFCKEA